MQVKSLTIEQQSNQHRPGFAHTTHTYAPFLKKVLFLCFNNPKHQP